MQGLENEHKGQIVNILGLETINVSVATGQLCWRRVNQWVWLCFQSGK